MVVRTEGSVSIMERLLQNSEKIWYEQLIMINSGKTVNGFPVIVDNRKKQLVLECRDHMVEKIMKKIALRSDTHGCFDENIYRWLENCDEIWHTGDIGNIEVADRLAAFKP